MPAPRLRPGLAASSALLALLAGCPAGDEGPTPTVAERSGGGAAAADRPVPAAEPADPGDGAAAAAADDPEDAAAPDPVAEASLTAGAQLPCAANVRLGFYAVERLEGPGGAEPLAELSVGSAQMSYRVYAAEGSRLWAGRASLRVLELDAGADPARVRLGWLAAPDPGREVAAIRTLGPAPAGADRLDAMGFYALPDGRVLAVGNVRPGPDGPRVTLSLYPPGYSEDPMQDYALAVDVAPGATIGDLVLADATAGSAAARGSVRVRRP